MLAFRVFNVPPGLGTDAGAFVQQRPTSPGTRLAPMLISAQSISLSLTLPPPASRLCPLSGTRLDGRPARPSSCQLPTHVSYVKLQRINVYQSGRSYPQVAFKSLFHSLHAWLSAGLRLARTDQGQLWVLTPARAQQLQLLFRGQAGSRITSVAPSSTLPAGVSLHPAPPRATPISPMWMGSGHAPPP